MHLEELDRQTEVVCVLNLLPEELLLAVPRQLAAVLALQEWKEGGGGGGSK